MFGFLCVNKPTGFTSRDVVNRVQRIVRPLKTGHAGTLDPLATGVLVVALGGATRLISYVQAMPKRYRGTFRLGCTSKTEDTEGEVIPLDDPPVPTREEIEQLLPQFVGELQQMPPAFSALKVKGRRAYELARLGEEVKLTPRAINIYDLQIVRYEYPELVLDVKCGSGTYIRSLGRDIGLALHSGAVMCGLERTEIGCFRIDEAASSDALVSETAIEQHLQPPLVALQALPKITMNADQLQALSNGMSIENPEPGPEVAAVDNENRLVAILVPRGHGKLGPLRNFIAKN